MVNNYFSQLFRKYSQQIIYSGSAAVEVVENKEREESDSDSDDEDTDSKSFIPCSQEATMVHGNKAVTALNLDPSGARLASG